MRHGPTEWNALGRIQGHTDTPLSEAGIAAMRRRRPPALFDTARAFASPLRRTRETAEALGLAGTRLDSRLMEQNWGFWEGLRRPEILSLHGKDAFIRAGRGEDFRPPGGESTRELHRRVRAFLREVAEEDADAIAVTHLGVLRAAYTLATGWDMATPLPAGLDISKALVLALTKQGAASIDALNVALPPRR
ncbi:MAG: histidine phosphatase family protein [Rhizomicrobium sp.]